MSAEKPEILKQDLAFPNEQELKTARFLVKKLKTDILFLAPSRSFGVKTPDLKMGHEYWEIKTLIGKNNRTVENIFRRASKQAFNLIIDLRHVDMSDERIINKIKYRFDLGQKRIIKRVLIITKSNDLIELKR